ncbi:MAG: PilZ domain-containing protein [Planctomycetota bacterium]
MQNDRRVHKRFPLKLSIFCQKVGLSGNKLIPGRTVNVSPGGLLVEMKGGNLINGELLSVEMSVPPTEGLLDFGGSFSSYARVVRSDNHQDSEESSEKVAALEFCDSPKLRI